MSASDANVQRCAADRLRVFGRELLGAGGMSRALAEDVADVLLEGDLLGHHTHGFSLLSLYLEEITAGRMAKSGEPRVVSDHGSAVTWDGDYLPGPWLVRRAIKLARERLRDAPMASVAIGRSHHIACLQAFLKPIVDDGLFVLLTCSDPGNRWVAPHGGRTRVYSPNPIAAGIPTGGDPVLIDFSVSSTAFNQVARAARAGRDLPAEWLIDAEGRPTADPRPLFEHKAGALLPLGGANLGYKGFGLALIVEALTSALAGHGRAQEENRWGSSVFLLLIDPKRFGGREAFLRETSWLAAACHASETAPGAPPVRLPGEAALARRREQLERGVVVEDATRTALTRWAETLRVATPW